MQAFSAVKQTIKMDVDNHSRSEFVFNKWPWYWYTNEWRNPLWCGQCRIKNKCNTIMLLRCRALFYFQSFTLCGNKNSVNKCDLESRRLLAVSDVGYRANVFTRMIKIKRTRKTASVRVTQALHFDWFDPKGMGKDRRGKPRKAIVWQNGKLKQT